MGHGAPVGLHQEIRMTAFYTGLAPKYLEDLLNEYERLSYNLFTRVQYRIRELVKRRKAMEQKHKENINRMQRVREEWKGLLSSGLYQFRNIAVRGFQVEGWWSKASKELDQFHAEAAEFDSLVEKMNKDSMTPSERIVSADIEELKKHGLMIDALRQIHKSLLNDDKKEVRYLTRETKTIKKSSKKRMKKEDWLKKAKEMNLKVNSKNTVSEIQNAVNSATN